VVSCPIIDRYRAFFQAGAMLWAAKMSETVQIETQLSKLGAAACAPARRSTVVFWLQGVTVVWMLVECGVSLYAAASAHSPALLAFGSDSFVELLSAGVVLLQFLPHVSISERNAARAAGALLFALALIVGFTAVGSLALHLRPETSRVGIGITLAALIVMPILARLKRREACRSNNAALAADAVQSATCAYLAVIALAGLAINALFHIAWFDSAAALVAIPLLLKEGRAAWHGKACGCC
jgi:divalent metal cation (Fe/Co/Zn/Cd) transporter